MIDYEKLTHLDLFSGIGGFSLASQWSGFETTYFVEINSFCQNILRKHWPNVPIHSDIKTFDSQSHVDLITGGFPCQPFSISGKKRGVNDDRYLWPEMFRIIRKSRPTWIIVENVTGILSIIDHIIDQLEGENYTCWTLCIPASLIGAPHKRERIWIIANSNEQRCNSREDSRKKRYIQSNFEWDIKTFQQEWSQLVPEPWKTFNAEAWLSESPVHRTDDGVPDNMDRIKALGNSIVPQCAYPILQVIRKYYD